MVATLAAPYTLKIDTGETGSKDLFFPDERSADSARAILAGETYPWEWVNRLLGPAPKTVVDIGANAGGFSLKVNFLWPGSTIFAFEPGVAAFTCLSQNLTQCGGARAFQYGLGLGAHTVALNSSLFGTVGGSVGTAGVHLANSESIEIRDAGETLVALGVNEIDILKIDTEGCELPILNSLGDLADQAKVVLVEYHSEEDRREIDQMLSSTHKLVHAHIDVPHRGDLCFGVNALAGRWDSLRITLPPQLTGKSG